MSKPALHIPHPDNVGAPLAVACGGVAQTCDSIGCGSPSPCCDAGFYQGLVAGPASDMLGPYSHGIDVKMVAVADITHTAPEITMSGQCNVVDRQLSPSLDNSASSGQVCTSVGLASHYDLRNAAGSHTETIGVRRQIGLSNEEFYSSPNFGPRLGSVGAVGVPVADQDARLILYAIITNSGLMPRRVLSLALNGERPKPGSPIVFYTSELSLYLDWNTPCCPYPSSVLVNVRRTNNNAEPDQVIVSEWGNPDSGGNYQLLTDPQGLAHSLSITLTPEHVSASTGQVLGTIINMGLAATVGTSEINATVRGGFTWRAADETGAYSNARVECPSLLPALLAACGGGSCVDPALLSARSAPAQADEGSVLSPEAQKILDQQYRGGGCVGCGEGFTG